MPEKPRPFQVLKKKKNNNKDHFGGKNALVMLIVKAVWLTWREFNVCVNVF